MEFFKIGDTIDYSRYNGLVYLLRKFKRLRTSINLGEKNIVNKYGTYRFIGDFTSVNGNFILEEDVNIYANDVFKNAIYGFVFNVINVDTSEEINRRVIYKYGSTGDDGILNITLPEDMIEGNEVILPEVIIDVNFDTHEYQNGLNSFKTSLAVQHQYLTSGTNKITVTITEQDDTPVADINTTIYINGVAHQIETDNNGKAEYNYQYTGKAGKVIVKSNGETAVFFDGGINFIYNKFTKKTEIPPDYFSYMYEMELGYHSNNNVWLETNGVVQLSCAEDGSQIVLENPKTIRTFRGAFMSETQVTGTHWTIVGDVAAIGRDMFNSLYGLTEIFLPRGIEKIGAFAFYYCTDLKSIEIPDTVYVLDNSCFFGSGIEKIKLPASINSIGTSAFARCKIKTYELGWKDNEIISYNKNKFPVINETIFKIPSGEKDNYVAKNYPAERLVEEVNYELNIQALTPIISLGETASAVATLTGDEEPVVGEEIAYTIKHDSTVITTGTATTNSNGEVTISYTGTGVGDIEIEVSYDDINESIVIEDCIFYGDIDKVKSTFQKNTGVSGRIIYYPNATYNQDVELSWSFKNNIPNQFLIGFANPLAPFTPKLSLYKNTNGQYIFYWSDSSRDKQEYVLGMNPTVNDVFKITSENIDKLYMYLNDTIEGYRNTNTSLPLQLRIDDFNNTMELDFIKIKAI